MLRKYFIVFFCCVKELINYCATDVQATFEVFKILYQIFLERFPHPVTFAGMLEMSTMYLPINKNWERFIDNCQNAYDDAQNILKNLLVKSANQACEFSQLKELGSFFLFSNQLFIRLFIRL